jgi:hypothetical protein
VLNEQFYVECLSKSLEQKGQRVWTLGKGHGQRVRDVLKHAVDGHLGGGGRDMELPGGLRCGLAELITIGDFATGSVNEGRSQEVPPSASSFF